MHSNTQCMHRTYSIYENGQMIRRHKASPPPTSMWPVRLRMELEFTSHFSHDNTHTLTQMHKSTPPHILAPTHTCTKEHTPTRAQRWPHTHAHTHTKVHTLLS